MGKTGHDMINHLMLGLAARGAEERADNPNQAARQANADMDRQHSRDAATELAVETMIRLCIEKGLFTEEEFVTTARNIDMEDGVMDGRRDLNKMRRICSNCQKPNSADRPACMWCGASIVDVEPEPVPTI